MTEYALSIDVEEWFHTHNLRPAVSRDSWESREARITDTVGRLLDLCDRHDARATFFVLGWVAEQYPDLIAEIDARGHRVGTHGYGHELVYELSPDEFRTDLRRSIEAIRPQVDSEVSGYRAPSFSITDWATEILAEVGIEYDSSLFRASAHDRYGSLSTEADSTVTRLASGIREVQLPVVDIPGIQIPCAGGAYFRLLPYPLFRRIVSRSREAFVFYLHPWEIDPDQPRITDVPLSYRLRHYTNLERTEGRLDRLLADFDWSPIESLL